MADFIANPAIRIVDRRSLFTHFCLEADEPESRQRAMTSRYFEHSVEAGSMLMLPAWSSKILH
ncbi:hypothetical protein [Sorangium sp. So ce381]|uniref:hypothetical protein n=1 Tax=Sorangium sp. So ce381 TaxID=3133307 RepID=UPI003F5B3205